ncbi:hypothetical protein [Paracraurococcus ruber]|uniref:Lipoprotein n=1 Tax=Paracraurococcus ruber TaxID=77675 RepID=A0ABS1D0L2_9PROT|nr:hypothetical protein [Paracraurococcus ruber]MBK1660338.1 hypothetical protein [Paracraurococcus ruber]TDG31353.1 hypothetical protein E2C05_11335 [Paracraurococcus ruber]
MHPTRTLLLLSLLAALGGCAEIAAALCHGQAQRAGLFLGTRYAGTSCSSSPGYVRKGRVTPGTTVCTPNFTPVYQWNEASDRTYAVCMAEVARRYPPRAAAAPRQADAAAGKDGMPL